MTRQLLVCGQRWLLVEVLHGDVCVLAQAQARFTIFCNSNTNSAELLYR